MKPEAWEAEEAGSSFVSGIGAKGMPKDDRNNPRKDRGPRPLDGLLGQAGRGGHRRRGPGGEAAHAQDIRELGGDRGYHGGNSSLLEGNDTCRCLLTVPGIGPKTASELAIPIDIEDFPSHDGLASCCGLAPRNRQSGTPISSVTASRQGNKRLKNLLVFSCNHLTRTEGRWGDYHARCRERGVPHGKALKALARKRLKVIYAAMWDRVPYAA